MASRCAADVALRLVYSGKLEFYWAFYNILSLSIAIHAQFLPEPSAGK
jgi:hypothetical protein